MVIIVPSVPIGFMLSSVIWGLVTIGYCKAHSHSNSRKMLASHFVWSSANMQKMVVHLIFISWHIQTFLGYLRTSYKKIRKALSLTVHEKQASSRAEHKARNPNSEMFNRISHKTEHCQYFMIIPFTVPAIILWSQVR